MDSVYLPGPTICGLHGMFESDFGCSESTTPYPRVTPSRVGAALLPFHCPRCESVVDFTDSKQREHYHDTRVVNGKQHDNYWCPACGQKFFLNRRGQPLKGEVGADGAASSTIEQIQTDVRGLVDIVRRIKCSLKRSMSDYVSGCDVMGCCP